MTKIGYEVIACSFHWPGLLASPSRTCSSVHSANECSRHSCRNRAWVLLTRLRRESRATVCSHSFHPLNQLARTPTWSRNIMVRGTDARRDRRVDTSTRALVQNRSMDPGTWLRDDYNTVLWSQAWGSVGSGSSRFFSWPLPSWTSGDRHMRIITFLFRTELLCHPCLVISYLAWSWTWGWGVRGLQGRPSEPLGTGGHGWQDTELHSSTGCHFSSTLDDILHWEAPKTCTVGAYHLSHKPVQTEHISQHRWLFQSVFMNHDAKK